jgi:hypothetical protein
MITLILSTLYLYLSLKKQVRVAQTVFYHTLYEHPSLPNHFRRYQVYLVEDLFGVFGETYFYFSFGALFHRLPCLATVVGQRRRDRLGETLHSLGHQLIVRHLTVVGDAHAGRPPDYRPLFAAP